MDTMPRLPLRAKNLYAFALAVLVLVFLAGAGDASAQRRRRPATSKQQQSSANANTQAPQAAQRRKNITPLKSGDTAEGSRITITSDEPLNDYSAYRAGDRYYVVIPEANAPRAAGGLKGKGFEDVQVQKRGNDAVLSFKLQPGTNARVQQRFNRLDIELTTPGGGRTPTASQTPATAKTTPSPTPQATASPSPEVASTANANNTTAGGPKTGTVESPVGPTVVYTPTPEATASPGASPEVSPAATPATEQVAQAQQPVLTGEPSNTTAAPAASSPTTLGTVLRQKWLVILIGALVLLSLVMIVAARSRAQRGGADIAAAPEKRRPTAKERKAARKVKADLDEADAAASISVADSLYHDSKAPKAKPLATATKAVAVAGAAEAVKEEEKPAPASADVERAETEVKNVLAGESYDDEVLGSTDPGTRQLVAAGLLAALASRNAEQRTRARAAFIKHDYLIETTRALRTADAPAERAAAARSLGYIQDNSVTPHLVAALDDDSPEVRRAAVESLAEIKDPEAVEPLSRLLKRERDRKVPGTLIERAIEASAAVAVEEPPAAEVEAPAVAEAVTVEEETPTLETEAPTLEAEAPAAEAEVVTVETERPAAALLDVSATEAASAIIAAPVAEEVDTEAEEAARREAEEEAARQRAEEEERARAEEERARVEAEAQRKAEEERLAAEAETRRQAEEEAARLRAEEEERLRAEEEARLRAEEEARLAAEEEARLAAEAEARRLAEEETARLRAEEEARQRAEEEERERARLAEVEAARLKAEEEARLAAEAEARRQAEEEAHRAEEARLAAEAEARRKAEEEAARLRAEEEARRQAEEEARRAEAERLRLEEEERQRAAAEAARLRAEEEAARQRAEEEARQRALEEEHRRQEEERLRAEEEAARLRAEEEARLAAEAEARLAAEAEAVRKAEEEAERLRAEEAARLEAEEEARRLAAEEAAAVLNAEAVSPVEAEYAEELGPSAGWVDVDVRESLTAPEEAVPVGLVSATPAEVSREIERSDFAVVEEPPPLSKELDRAVTEKGIAEFDEFSSVPGAILKRLSSEEAADRAAAVQDLSRVGGDDSFREINAAFDDPAVEVRNAAARSLFNFNADRAATFTRALRESPPERRRKIGAALASSGLASEAIGQLMGESRERTYDAFSLLFLMSKAGEVQPLMRAIEEHPNNEVRLAVVKLLALSGQQEILPAFRRLAVRGSLPTEVRSAVMEAIYQISSQSPTAA